MRVGFLNINWTDVLDVFLVAVLLYQIYTLVRGSIASRVFLGYLFVYVFYLVVRGLGLGLLTAILQYFMGVGAVALIVIFQQEIRRFLLIIGKSTIYTNNGLLKRILGSSVVDVKSKNLKEIVEASKSIAANFTGALIVINKKDDLGKFIETGEMLDAKLSKPLLVSLFNQYSELHDGAVVIIDGRLKAARCVLPVADGVDVPSSLGFRHRAAMGMSEATDAVVIVISEQTGKISLAVEGELYSNIHPSELLGRLEEYLSSEVNHLVK
ncbi:Cyclic di-AMP synthase CdaA [Dyadobacter sp. CECT 9275]|uniref:Diadenylate cyclase n=1 Tax=Dyadobacter helix TaxID=2822344 RepID=A0A916JAM3_9BACT|nr:diadenylate cyclase CdaA [Dyadobacter sp. CECT 9275]CAG4998741.1 Cyclic di-AMP synthase CdaA [Dyadobacter sp. CECT 9275]